MTAQLRKVIITEKEQIGSRESRYMAGKNKLTVSSEKMPANTARVKILQNILEVVMDRKWFTKHSFAMAE